MGELSKTTINGVSYDLKDAGAARQSHSHTKSQITDFPTSMPASDVSSWAKASTKPSYTASEVNAVATTANQGLSDTQKSNARSNIGAGTSSFSGSYNDLSNKPTLGTAAAKDVPSSGNASTSQVVMGNDSRLSDARTPTSHTHTKSQITDFPTSMPASDVYSWAKASSKPSYTASEVGAIATTAKGAASGVAELDANGKVPSSQLPSYVDDVLEYSAKSSFPSTGETGKIYVDTSTNKTYRWSGSAYVEISESLALGETSSTAYRGDRGKAAYDHSQASGNPHGTTGAGVNLTGYSKGSSTSAVTATDTVNAAIAKHENRIDANQTNILLMMNGVNHNMIYRGQNLGATFTDAQHTALSSGNFTDLFLGDYWTKSVTIPAGTYTGGDGEEVTVAAQTVTLKAVIADFDTFYAGYASSYAGINTHHAGVIVTGFNNVVWNKTNSTAGGYVSSLIHKWLVGSVLPQLESWFGSAKVLSHQKLLTNAITGDAASNWAWSSQKISLLSECQLYGMKVWGGSKATNGAYEPGEAFKKLDVFNHIDANLLFGNKNIWCRDIASAGWAAGLRDRGGANFIGASTTWLAPAALILLS